MIQYPSEFIPINLANAKEEIEASPDNLIVLAYPTHGFLPPWSVVKFIFKMPFKKGTHFFRRYHESETTLKDMFNKKQY